MNSTAVAEALEPVRRLSRDLKKSARLIGRKQARYLTDLYYEVQEFRKAAANMERSVAPGEPHEVVDWVFSNTEIIETGIKRALGEFASEWMPGRWMQCAPPGSLVTVSGAGNVPIETLRDGDKVVALDRHHANLTGYRPQFGNRIAVNARRYIGNLVSVAAGSQQTRTTPSHKWPVAWLPDFGKHMVYLMQRGSQFRVGWCRLFQRRSDATKTGRLRVLNRARQERADAVWVLQLFDNARDASLYESYVATRYGLPLIPFQPCANSTYFTDDFIAEFFGMLDANEQAERAAQALQDHGLHPGLPFYDFRAPVMHKGCHGTMYAINLLPRVMALARPDGEKMRWHQVEEVKQVPYAGDVYSLDVAKYHTYIQDGLCTCNSLVGIGPVISAGMLAHLDVRLAQTAGHFWRFAGLDPSVRWEKKTKRPWNAALKRLCWIAGDCFVKFQSHEQDYYGALYVARKEIETRNNDRKAFAEQARASLREKNFGKDTEARKWYEKDQLPPARLHLRALRWTAKIFLSHLHHVMYVSYYKRNPPVPYSFEKSNGDHRHFIEIPNWPFTEGRPLSELLVD
jgi:hypothetical protein